MPRRVATGIDPRRLAMIVAVLSRHAGLALGQADVVRQRRRRRADRRAGRRSRRLPRRRLGGPRRARARRPGGVRRGRSDRPAAARDAGRASARGVREASAARPSVVRRRGDIRRPSKRSRIVEARDGAPGASRPGSRARRCCDGLVPSLSRDFPVQAAENPWKPRVFRPVSAILAVVRRRFFDPPASWRERLVRGRGSGCTSWATRSCIRIMERAPS